MLTKYSLVLNSVISLVCVLSMNACSPSAAKVSEKSGFKQQYIATAKFNLNSYYRIRGASPHVNIYIEGDGRVLANKRMLSRDPSPQSTLVLQLATLDPAANVYYLARPCQNSPQDLETVCLNKYWTDARYSEEIVSAIDQAISKIKQESKAQHVNLIGYSGGGAIAVLVAARRNDIHSIRTVAGNLDLKTMEKIHDTPPLVESLDPTSVAVQVKNIPQLHFVGAEDPVVPEIVAQNYCSVAGLDQTHIKTLKHVTHVKGWVQEWPHLIMLKPQS